MNQPPSLKAKFVTVAPGDILFTGSPSGSAACMEIVGFDQAIAYAPPSNKSNLTSVDLAASLTNSN
jgi:2-keto-4-pentenoate hydratase/2-oxohepta-3-ene-1,7-dioic acid hydratase in catechol pathway